ncbi:MAG: GAF domain-containing protein [Pyrinomonadaceae bacterium]
MKAPLRATLSNIVSLALDQVGLNGIETILKETAEAVGACGCVLWESEPFANIERDPPTGNLYVFAKWFCDNLTIPLRKLPIDDSANGYAIKHKECQNIEDVKTNSITSKKYHEAIGNSNLTSMYSVPFSFYGDNNKVNASLAVYRRTEIQLFDEEEREFIDTVAKLIPQLYQAICDKVGQKLLSDINGSLDKIETKANNDDGSKVPIELQIENIKASLDEICNKIAVTFGCIETSLFFENRLESESIFKFYATSFKEWATAKVEYLPQKNEGLTAWALAEGLPIRIFNLSTFHEDREDLQQSYPGVEWNDSLKFDSELFKGMVRKILGLDADSELPPLSFMAVPIVRRNRLFGVIRCCTAKESPWFFSKQHLEILELIVVPISRFWKDFLIHLEEKRETESWEKLVEEINKQHKKVQGQFDRLDFNKNQLFDEILRITNKTIEGSDILDIRLEDKDSKELSFVRTLGKEWNKGSKGEIESRINKRFSRSDKKRGIGFEVLDSGNVCFITNVEEEDYDPKTFPKTKRIIVAPIGVEDKNIGVLDIRSTGPKQFASNAPIMAELIGRQLGLYLSLWEIEKRQRRVFEDTWHQLKSPVRLAFARAKSLLDKDFIQSHSIDSGVADEIVTELQMLRGVSRKANRVLANAGIFAELATKGELKQAKNQNNLKFDFMMRLLFGIVTDTKLIFANYRKIKFQISKESFMKLNQLSVKANFDYLEQAINCLIDNASKYSYEETTVRIFGGEESVENQRYFYIAFENLGIEIKPDEIPKLVRRKYRGELAELIIGEGSGIGLWVTDHIMRAHGGKLVVMPTDQISNLTTAKLLFPVS